MPPITAVDAAVDSKQLRSMILDRLSRGVAGWRCSGEFAHELGAPIDDVEDALSVLSMAGLIEVRPRSPAICLSPLGAIQCGVEIHSAGDTLVWQSCKLQQQQTRVRSCDQPPPLFFDLIDPAPDPLDSDIAREEEELAYQARFLPDRDPYPEIVPRDPPRPRVILGLRSPWDPWDESAPCPACRGARLKPEEYCARCDNWGYEHCPPTH